MIHSFKIADTISAYRGVYLSAANTVALPGTGCTTNGAVLPIGVTVDSSNRTATGVAVACAGEIAKLYFNDSVGAGLLVGLDASGRGVPVTTGLTSTAISAPCAYLGVLLGAKVNTTGTVAEVLVMPGLTRITL